MIGRSGHPTEPGSQRSAAMVRPQDATGPAAGPATGAASGGRTSLSKLIPTGRAFFALGVIGLGAAHFVFGAFVTGRAPAWPESVPGGVVWAYLSGAFFIAAGIAMVVGKKGRAAAILAASLILLWALVRHIPVLASTAFLSGAWTAAGKALWLAGGCLTMAATFPPSRNDRDSVLVRFANLEEEFVTLGRVCIALFLIQSGIQHFMFTGFVASLIPAWFPGDAVLWTRFAGVALIAGGLGLFVPRTARPAAFLSGLMVFSWFWIVHIPRTFQTVSDGIAVFEALAASGLLFVLAGSLARLRDRVR